MINGTLTLITAWLSDLADVVRLQAAGYVHISHLVCASNKVAVGWLAVRDDRMQKSWSGGACNQKHSEGASQNTRAIKAMLTPKIERLWSSEAVQQARFRLTGPLSSRLGVKATLWIGSALKLRVCRFPATWYSDTWTSLGLIVSFHCFLKLTRVFVICFLQRCIWCVVLLIIEAWVYSLLGCKLSWSYCVAKRSQHRSFDGVWLDQASVIE